MTAATQAAAMNHRKQQENGDGDDGFVSVPTKSNNNMNKPRQQQKGRRQQQAGRGRGGGRGGGGRGKNSFYSDPFKKKGWSKPASVKEEKKQSEEEIRIQQTAPSLPYNDEVSEQIASVVTGEFQETPVDNVDDQINTALASTAAAALFATVAGDSMEESKTEQTPSTDFRSMMKGSNMADLMADFGEQDKDWKNKEPVNVSESDEADAKSPTKSQQSKPSFPSRLAPHDKAPIHISLESFGYIHGAVTGSKESWSPFSQPLAPLQCSDNVTEPIPNYLLFHDGLRSGHIKRLLREQAVTLDDGNDNDGKSRTNNYRNLHEYARKYVAKQWIWPKIVEAQVEGQHGYVNPVTMTISIGSHLGRHRSVVVVEWAAAEVRALLRKNAGGVLTCPVSVGTFHRDVEKKVPAHATDRKAKERDYDDPSDRI